MSEAWLTNSWMAVVFFRYIRRYKVPATNESRAPIMRRIVAKHKAKYIRDLDDFMRGKKGLFIRPKGDNE